MDLMYKIPGEEQIVLTLWYRSCELRLVMYPIIIADIAPRIPGGLTHFNWPRLLSNKPIYRVYHKTYHRMVTHVRDRYIMQCGK